MISRKKKHLLSNCLLHDFLSNSIQNARQNFIFFLTVILITFLCCLFICLKTLQKHTWILSSLHFSNRNQLKRNEYLLPISIKPIYMGIGVINFKYQKNWNLIQAILGNHVPFTNLSSVHYLNSIHNQTDIN